MTDFTDRGQMGMDLPIQDGSGVPMPKVKPPANQRQRDDVAESLRDVGGVLREALGVVETLEASRRPAIEGGIAAREFRVGDVVYVPGRVVSEPNAGKLGVRLDLQYRSQQITVGLDEVSDVFLTCAFCGREFGREAYAGRDVSAFMKEHLAHCDAHAEWWNRQGAKTPRGEAERLTTKNTKGTKEDFFDRGDAEGAGGALEQLTDASVKCTQNEIAKYGESIKAKNRRISELEAALWSANKHVALQIMCTYGDALRNIELIVGGRKLDGFDIDAMSIEILGLISAAKSKAREVMLTTKETEGTKEDFFDRGDAEGAP